MNMAATLHKNLVSLSLLLFLALAVFAFATASDAYAYGGQGGGDSGGASESGGGADMNDSGIGRPGVRKNYFGKRRKYNRLKNRKVSDPQAQTTPQKKPAKKIKRKVRKKTVKKIRKVKKAPSTRVRTARTAVIPGIVKWKSPDGSDYERKQDRRTGITTLIKTGPDGGRTISKFVKGKLITKYVSIKRPIVKIPVKADGASVDERNLAQISKVNDKILSKFLNGKWKVSWGHHLTIGGVKNGKLTINIRDSKGKNHLIVVPVSFMAKGNRSQDNVVSGDYKVVIFSANINTNSIARFEMSFWHKGNLLSRYTKVITSAMVATLPPVIAPPVVAPPVVAPPAVATPVVAPPVVAPPVVAPPVVATPVVAPPVVAPPVVALPVATLPGGGGIAGGGIGKFNLDESTVSSIKNTQALAEKLGLGSLVDMPGTIGGVAGMVSGGANMLIAEDNTAFNNPAGKYVEASIKTIAAIKGAIFAGGVFAGSALGTAAITAAFGAGLAGLAATTATVATFGVAVAGAAVASAAAGLIYETTQAVLGTESLAISAGVSLGNIAADMYGAIFD